MDHQCSSPSTAYETSKLQVELELDLEHSNNSVSPPLMARCPRCSKHFMNESRVLQHLNQPVSACLAYHEEVKRMNSTKAMAASRNPSEDDFQHPIQEFIQDPEPISEEDSELNMNIDSDSDVDNHSTSSNSPFIEVYPEAGQKFGCGETFLDVFDTDCHAEKREQHPYYPFASKAEWGLASFLLCSDLSMNSIDKFLKLDLVSGL